MWFAHVFCHNHLFGFCLITAWATSDKSKRHKGLAFFAELMIMAALHPTDRKIRLVRMSRASLYLLLRIRFIHLGNNLVPAPYTPLLQLFGEAAGIEGSQDIAVRRFRNDALQLIPLLRLSLRY